MTEKNEDALQVQLSKLETHIQALDKQTRAIIQQAQQQTEAIATINRIKQQLAVGAIQTATIAPTSRWDRPYSYAHYLIQQNEERAKEAEAGVDALLTELEALKDVTFPSPPEEAQQTLEERIAALEHCLKQYEKMEALRYQAVQKRLLEQARHFGLSATTAPNSPQATAMTLERLSRFCDPPPCRTSAPCNRSTPDASPEDLGGNG